MATHTPESRLSAWLRRWCILVGAAAALLPAMVWLSADYGVTWDEPARQRYGLRIWEFYQGRHGYERFPADGTHLYAGLFDVTAVALQKALPFDPYVIRHALNAVFGWVGIACCGALAARLGGRRAGLLAMLLLALAPRYFGHSMNNPKDIPFAALAAASLVPIAAIRPQYPWLPPRVAAGLAITIGLALSVRPGGLLLLLYAGGALAFAIARARDFALRRLLITAATFTAVALVATTIPLPVWPWLQQHPYAGLLEAVAGVSRFDWNGRVLFDGQSIRAAGVPWSYVPVWLLYTTPPVVLLGALLSLARLRRSPGRVAAGGLWFACLFPVAYVIAKESTLYDGIRHLLFILPPLIALAALGWTWLIDRTSGAGRLAAALLLAVGLAEPLVFQMRNHPNQVVYFNHLLGGPRAAFGRFDLDYWGNCLRQAVVEAEALAREAEMVVLVSGRRLQLLQLNAARTHVVRGIPARLERHHLEVTLFRGPPSGLAKAAARRDVVYRIAMADGTPICSVTRGPRFAELRRRLPAGFRRPSPESR